MEKIKIPTSKRNLLFIGNHLSNTGQNMSVGEELAFRLEQRGYQILLVSHKQNKLVKLVDILSKILSKQRFYDLAEVDVFSGPAFLWSFLSVSVLKLLGKPIILNLHGGNLPDYSVNHPLRVKWLLSWADVVVAPSSFLKDTIALIRADIQVIPNGLDINHYLFKLRDNPQPKLVWLRAFHQIYNPSLAPKILRSLLDQSIDANLLMVGPDKGDGSLKKMLGLATELGVSDRIKVIPGVSKAQVPEILRQGDIFVNTTNFDNTPVSVIEAMASGCCIVTTNVGGIPYLLEDGIDALLVPPNDPDAMANAVLRVLTESGLAEKLSINARRKAEQFDWSIVLPQWEEVFEKVINN